MRGLRRWRADASASVSSSRPAPHIGNRRKRQPHNRVECPEGLPEPLQRCRLMQVPVCQFLARPRENLVCLEISRFTRVPVGADITHVIFSVSVSCFGRDITRAFRGDAAVVILRAPRLLPQPNRDCLCPQGQRAGRLRKGGWACFVFWPSMMIRGGWFL
jgi:hypothetical protein